MKRFPLFALTALSCAAAALPPAPARACGGCFHGSNESTPSVVTGHRMALSISEERTVLWDQVQYAGDPKDFAWVLPVGPGAFVEEASDAWFEALEAVSSTHIMSPTVICNGRAVRTSESNFSCGGSAAAAPLAEDGAPEMHQVRDTGGVTVEHEGTVGPYETVTLKSDDPNALRKWLISHGYAIPADIEPVIDAYVKQKSEFIALRLQPDAGVRQMTPVRVITPGASPTLPLRMVAAGTGADVSIVLYVLAEGRYHTQNFTDESIDFTKLSWDWSQLKSNFAELRSGALSGGGFLTSFALQSGLTGRILAPDGLDAQFSTQSTNGPGAGPFDNLTDLYFAQADADMGTSSSCGSIANSLRDVAQGTVVTDADKPAAGQVAASSFACGGYTDIATALVGMHPADVWVTRLEANLPRAMLGSDLTLAASPSQVAADNWHVAAINIGSPCPPPDTSAQSTPQKSSGFCSASQGPRSPLSSAVTGGLAVCAALFAARRARRRSRR
jgi:Uncharacterized protein conserved in bacteria (DUF2330)